MFFSRLLATAILATTIVSKLDTQPRRRISLTLLTDASQNRTLVNKGIPAPDSPDLSNTATTDDSTIADTAQNVDQKSGPGPNDPPNLPPANTTVTAIDGQLVDNVPVNSTTTRRRREIPGRFARAMKRNSGYEQVFSGTGTGPSDRDGSIQGTAYLTYTLVSNTTTYDVATDACQNFCDGIETCGKFFSGILSVALK
jgi:hypothetical protein